MSERDRNNSETDSILPRQEFADTNANTAAKAQNDAKERLGFGLRSVYRNVLDEPIPDDMLSLLEALDEKGGQEESNKVENSGDGKTGA